MANTNDTRIGTLATGVSEAITKEIRSGTFLPGRPLPSERELSAHFAVSRAVIRDAIKFLASSGQLHLSHNHRPVVREAIRHSPVAKMDLGVWLWPSSGHFTSASILKGIQSVSFEANVQVIVGSAVENDWPSVLKSERDFLDSMAENPSALGVIIWYLGGQENLPALKKVQLSGVPIVFVDRLPPQGFEVDYVGTNNVDGARHAVQHLLRLGHRRIGMISNIDPASSVAEREEGFLSALSDAGIDASDELIHRANYDSAEGVTVALESFLQLDNPVTAVFCVNDMLALTVYDILERMGLDVPRDFSVVGFDGLLRWVPGGGYLTTMGQDFERVGRIAASLVEERASGSDRKANRHYILDASLIHGASAAMPKANPLRINSASNQLLSSSLSTPLETLN